MRDRRIWGVGFALLTMTMGCQQDNPTAKLGFDLEILNEEGLYGPADGLRSMDYKFCLPAGSFVRGQVTDIDPSLQCFEEIGSSDCLSGEVLCIGNTHQENHKRILLALAKLDYIERIEQSFIE